MSKRIYGYCRISTQHQSIERQERNILAVYPEAIIHKEAFTGTKVEGRKELAKVLKVVVAGDTIVFDSVSRMSRNAVEGVALYEELLAKDVELVFLKEPTINSSVYKAAINQAVPMTGNAAVDAILKGVNEAMQILRKEQIEAAFKQAQKEVDDLHQRTAEGIETARRNGKQVGQVAGAKLHVKKAAPMKAEIRKHAKSFGGSLTDGECIKLLGLARNTYYKYKRELVLELTADLDAELEAI